MEIGKNLSIITLYGRLSVASAVFGRNSDYLSVVLNPNPPPLLSIKQKNTQIILGVYSYDPNRMSSEPPSSLKSG